MTNSILTSSRVRVRTTSAAVRMMATPLAAAASLGLTACLGGGGGDLAQTPAPALPSGSLPSDPLAAIPSTTTTTVSGVLTYQFLVLQVAADKADKAEPIDLTNVTLPSSDTTEPADV